MEFAEQACAAACLRRVRTPLQGPSKLEEKKNLRKAARRRKPNAGQILVMRKEPGSWRGGGHQVGSRVSDSPQPSARSC